MADRSRSEPGFAGIFHRLGQLGISADLSEHIVSMLDLDQDLEQTWNQALALLAHQVQVTDDDILSKGGVVALVGPTGVGKTTSIAKLAARFTLRYGNREVALISTDSYRIGAQEQLCNFGRILGIPTYMASTGDELRERISDLSDKRLVLIDTAGMSQRDIRLSQQLEELNNSSALVRSYAVISANTQANTMIDVMRAYSHIKLSGCILTKLDETTSLGGALSTVIRYQLPVAYISDGQRVPEDMHPARAHSLISRAAALMKQEEMMLEKYPTPVILNGNMTNAHV
jgi:flagellar biosynthesis protein FlhF